MTTTTPIQIDLSIDSSTMTAAEAATYVLDFQAHLAASATAATPGTSAHIVGLDKQMGRLYDHNPAGAERVKAAHEGLMVAGYTPLLPNSKKNPLPSYVMYLDADGVNLGYLNSNSFTFARKPLREQLLDFDHVVPSGERYALIELTSEDRVNKLLEIAATYAV